MELMPWNSEFLNLAAWRIAYDTLGPGKRLCIWVQGCLKKCPGCMAKSWRPIQDATLISPENFYKKFSHIPIDGVTISGGEPFLQPRALASLLKIMRPPNVICFSGYQYEELLTDNSCYPLLDLIDILIDGEFDEARNTVSGLRGSDNQRIIQLAKVNSVKKTLSARELETYSRKIEVIPESDGIAVVGIPERRVWQSLQALFSIKE